MESTAYNMTAEKKWETSTDLCEAQQLTQQYDQLWFPNAKAVFEAEG